MHSSKLRRVIRGYERNGDSLMVEVPLGEVDVSVLRKVFGVPEGDPMCDCYTVDVDQLQAIQRYICDSIDLRVYDFFLECDLVE